MAREMPHFVLCLVRWLPSHRAPVVLCFPSFLVLGVAFCALAGVALARVFLIFLEFASSSGYVSMRDLLPKRLEPSRRASSFVSSRSTTSCCWSSSCAEFGRHVVPEGGVGSCHVLVVSICASAVPMVVYAGGPERVCVVMLG